MPGEEIGLRNQLRARWRALPQQQRWAITVVLQLLLAILLFFVDHALGYATLVIAALLWLRKLSDLPRLAVEGALVVALAYPQPSLAIALAIVFAVFWAPNSYRRWLLPLAALLTAVAYPFFFDRMFTIPVFGPFPDIATGVYMVVFIMMAVGLNMVVGYAGLLDLG